MVRLQAEGRDDAKQCERVLELWNALPDYSIRPGINVVFKNGLYNRVEHVDWGEYEPGEQVVFVNFELFKDLAPPEPTILTIGDARRVKTDEIQGIWVLDPHMDKAMVFCGKTGRILGNKFGIKSIAKGIKTAGTKLQAASAISQEDTVANKWWVDAPYSSSCRPT